MSTQPTLLNIQILRGIAAMMVVVDHAIGQMESRGGRDLGLEIGTGLGQAGVDLFFVISGFIMVYVTHGRHRTPLYFWRDRIIRIVPLYWFYTLLMAAIALMVPAMLNTAAFEPLHVLKSLLFIPVYHNTIDGEIWPLLVQGWTLNFEMFFYFIFGCLLLVRVENHRLGLLTLCLVGLVLIGLLGGDATNPLFLTYTSPLLLEFLAGVLIAMAFHRGWLASPSLGWVCLVLGLVLFALTVIRPEWGGVRAITFGVPSALIVIAALSLESGRSGARILVALGDASYSIYLSHTFTLGVIGSVWAVIGNGSIAFDTTMFVLAIIVSAMVGMASYRLIERPMVTYFKPAATPAAPRLKTEP